MIPRRPWLGLGAKPVSLECGSAAQGEEPRDDGRGEGDPPTGDVHLRIPTLRHQGEHDAGGNAEGEPERVDEDVAPRAGAEFEEEPRAGHEAAEDPSGRAPAMPPPRDHLRGEQAEGGHDDAGRAEPVVLMGADERGDGVGGGTREQGGGAGRTAAVATHREAEQHRTEHGVHGEVSWIRVEPGRGERAPPFAGADGGRDEIGGTHGAGAEKVNEAEQENPSQRGPVEVQFRSRQLLAPIMARHPQLRVTRALRRVAKGVVIIGKHGFLIKNSVF